MTDTRHRPLVVQLEAPGRQGVCGCSRCTPVPVPVKLVPIAAAVRSDGGRTLTKDYARLQRMLPPLSRTDASWRGQVALSQEEAWEFLSRQARCWP